MGASMKQAPAKRTPARSSAGFTAPQMMILIVVAVLGVAALTLTGFLLFAPSEAPSAAAVAQPTAAETQQPASPTSTTAPTPSPEAQVRLPALPSSCALQNHPASEGLVAHVLDDGTLEVQIDQSTVKVVYAGIEIMPSVTDHSVKQAASAMLEGQPVLLVRDTSDTDAAGRLLRYVFTPGYFINYELIRQGLAAAQPDSADHTCAIYFLEAEQQARSNGLGGWKVTPVPTNTFMPFVEVTPAAACDCSVRYECSDFKTHEEAQACYNACNDYSSKLDDDRDGLACEDLP